jgi:hypothetical protein
VINPKSRTSIEPLCSGFVTPVRHRSLCRPEPTEIPQGAISEDEPVPGRRCGRCRWCGEVAGCWFGGVPGSACPAFSPRDQYVQR